jgi:hypothetical protein
MDLEEQNMEKKHLSTNIVDFMDYMLASQPKITL